MKYINDKIVKKALATDTKAMRKYVSQIIHECTKVPLEALEDNLKLVYPEVGFNIHTVDSLVDLAFKNDTHYFSIEINYTNNSKTRNISNIFYVYQLNLKQVKTSKEYQNLLPVYQIQLNYEDYYKKGDLIYRCSMKDDKYNLPYLLNEDKIFISKKE